MPRCQKPAVRGWLVVSLRRGGRCDEPLSDFRCQRPPPLAGQADTAPWVRPAWQIVRRGRITAHDRPRRERSDARVVFPEVAVPHPLLNPCLIRPVIVAHLVV